MYHQLNPIHASLALASHSVVIPYFLSWCRPSYVGGASLESFTRVCSSWIFSALILTWKGVGGIFVPGGSLLNVRAILSCAV